MFLRSLLLVCCTLSLFTFHPSLVLADHHEELKAEAQTADKKEETRADEKSDDKKDEPKVTQGTVTIDGSEVAYTATAGKLPMKSDDGETKADVFFVAYTVEAEGGKQRPITYCFNGGPGSSSVWLHLGMLGPQRVKLDSDAGRVRPPAELIANPYSLLDKTDLVFIDPVSTGYSRPAKGEKKNQFHGYDEDLKSVGQFIHDYTTKYGRWGSPKFLLGESYGGLRAAGLSGRLQDRYHMYLNGVVLISAVVDFQTLRANGNNDIGYALFLPAYAATAWYHEALDEPLQKLSIEKLVKNAEKFASGPYLRALLAGDSLQGKKREKIIARMSALTGLSEDFLDRAKLRVSMPQFGKELLRERRKVVGRFDGRYTGSDRDSVGEYTEHDPSGTALFGAFTSAMNQYLRDTLKVEEERVYEILTGNVHPWDYSEFTNRYVDASQTLRKAMADNPYLRVFAACGYYDLATPGFAMQYTRNHLGLSPELRDHIELQFYEGGHMMYVHEPSLEKLRDDLLKFYDTTLNAEVKTPTE
ncbi:S10 family peptidase [Adhaeretor mobilis]|uniref:Serine carboxypeptidase n=1 Tax=Adhaeretor mobilis TaxID=1930276 RepID=A0A517N0L8_9BACT|nr:peptidase S10 [Adhaeretor mobilis]QDT00682.1 Serine carboxypeptidase [Adhaeretor mobilis]